MKYRLILAEDEPAAAEHVYDLIRLYCPRFELAAAAENGAEAFELARKHRPSIVLTDIRMPVMDGLELIKRLHEELPDIKTIILSGYQDFEYAQTALRHGAADYLLKPISPGTMRKTLDRIIPLLEDAGDRRRRELLKRLLGGRPPSGEELRQGFTAPVYTAAISRKNGLPSRFAGALCFADAAGFADAASPGNTGDGAESGAFDFYGRDQMESIRLAPGASPLSQEALRHIRRLYEDGPGYITTVALEEPFPIEELPGIIKFLYSALDRSIVIMKSQTLSLCRAGGLPRKQSFQGAGDLKQSIAYFLKEKNAGQLKKLLAALLDRCRREERPQIYVEEPVRLFLEQVRLEGKESAGETPVDEGLEFMLDDAFFYAASYNELQESLFFILEKNLPLPQDAICKVDTPEFWGLIRVYVDTHLSGALSLQSLCAHFGISQTYMSRLFRKYSGLSFISYLTGLRIERAKQLLASGDILVKDAAAMTGFSDQFYFSRVFHSLTGCAPSEWRTKGD